MDIDYECLCCRKSDVHLYEMNQNSVLIESELIDFKDIIWDLLFAKLRTDVENYICEACKDLLTQFYIFKSETKQNLAECDVIKNVKEFMKSEEQDFPEEEEPKIVLCGHKLSICYGEDDDYEQIQELQEEDSTEMLDENFDSSQNSQDEDYDTKEEVVGISNGVEYVIGTENDDETYEVIENESSQEITTKSDNVLKPNKVCRCGFQCSSISKFHAHRTTCSLDSSFGCRRCNTKFKDIKYLQIHFKAHENFQAISAYWKLSHCTIAGCKMSFINQEDLNIHIGAHQNEEHSLMIQRTGAYEDIFLKNDKDADPCQHVENAEVCGYCGKKHKYVDDLKVHMLFFHITSFNCPFDNLPFKDAKHVRLFSEHIRNKHPEIFKFENLYSCRLCSQSFSTNFEKLAHMKLCDAKVFQCTGHCNKRFESEWHLKNHLKNLEDDRFTCEICGKKCVSRSDLEIHMRSHTNDRPYECSICYKKFKTSANRSSHMDIHERSKKHECEICGEKFQTRPILRKHKKKHDQQYQDECLCKICRRQYLSRPHLLRHLKAAHKAPADMRTSAIDDFIESISKER